jgi:hypothetical protein
MAHRSVVSSEESFFEEASHQTLLGPIAAADDDDASTAAIPSKKITEHQPSVSKQPSQSPPSKKNYLVMKNLPCHG